MASISLDELLKLPAAERIELAMALWESLSEADREAAFSRWPWQAAQLDRCWAEHVAASGPVIDRVLGRSS